jgi:hypothetical protein
VVGRLLIGGWRGEPRHEYRFHPAGAGRCNSIGSSFSWFAILISSTALAALSAAVLHFAGFDALSGIAIIATCLSVHQLAYGIGVTLARCESKEARKSRERHDKTAGTGIWPNQH